jgi:hypothetical protein
MEKPVEGEEEGASMGTRLDAFVVDWDDDAVGKVMSYVRDWNTNAKHVMVAQVSLLSPVMFFLGRCSGQLFSKVSGFLTLALSCLLMWSCRRC